MDPENQNSGQNRPGHGVHFTIALIDHRLHYIQQEEENWEDFHNACGEDIPNFPIITTLETLKMAGSDIWIFSGRSSEVREKTIEWLCANTCLTPNDLEEQLVMRDKGNYTPDHLLKKNWLDSMLDTDRKRLVAVFEDRTRVVQMWRDKGIFCYQVAGGDF